MDIIVEDKEYSFKELEQEIFRLVCAAGIDVTRKILAKKDEDIFQNIDKKKYTSGGFRSSSIKTVYGSVSYSRRVYRTKLEDGKLAYVYPLDKYLGIDKIGLISENLAEKIADLATEATYRETAETITATTGCSVSAQGAWGIMQRIGERIDEEENHSVNQMNRG